MVGYIYLVTNKINGKQYVGKTIKTVKHRWNHHLADAKRASEYAIHRAIRKYGRDAFEVKTIATVKAEAEDLLDDVEKFCIQFYSTLSNGYNMTEGGEGGVPTPESREKISKSLRRYFEDPSVRERNRQATIHYFENPMAREKASQAAGRRYAISAEREKTSQACLGKTRSPAARENIRKAKLGKPLSPEHREKIRQALLCHYEDPAEREKIRQASLVPETLEKNRQAHIGKTHSAETREKIRQAQLHRFEDPTEREKKRKADYATIIAYARAQRGITRSDIARYFNLSRRTVCRVLASAEN